MAFGKDPNNQARLHGNFSQQAAFSSRKRSTGGGGKQSYWSDNYKPSTNIDMIRMVPGSYKNFDIDDATGEAYETNNPWLHVVEHFHGGLKRGALCSAGPYRRFKNKREACYGCEMFWEDYAEREAIRQKTGQRPNKPRRVSMSDKRVFTVLDYGTFYKAEQIGSNGQVVLKRDGTPFYDWKKMLYANDPGAVGRELMHGRVMPWPMNDGQFKTLRAYNDSVIRLSCTTCKTYGHIVMQPGGLMQTIGVQSVSHNCRHCGNIVVDCRNSTMPPQQIDEIVGSPVQCPRCGTKDFLDEAIFCEKCAAQGTQPVRATIWDVDLQVRLQQDPQDSTKNQLIIVGHSEPRPVADGYANKAQPLDLASIFRPTSLEEQATLWNIGQAPAPQQQPGPVHPGMSHGMAAPGLPAAVPYGQAPAVQQQFANPQHAQPSAAAPQPQHFPPLGAGFGPGHFPPNGGQQS